MKRLKYYFVLSITLFSCERYEVITINTEDLTITIDENPEAQQLLGTILGTASQGSVVFALSSQSPVGAFEIDGSSGSLFVADQALFDFETNPTLTAEVIVGQAMESAIARITVNLNDIDEESITPEANIWSGPTIMFSKADGDDHLLEQNQDRLTNNVWLTRASTTGIFNIKSETIYTKLSSPSDTEWAFGISTSINSLTFKNWQAAVNNSPPDMLNKDMVLHLITDDIYIDIKFLSWSCCGAGGLSYVRSTQ